MAQRIEQLKAELIEEVVGLVHRRIEARRIAETERFVRAVYANVPPDDLRGQTPETWFGAALALLSFASQRKPGTAKIRVYNPSVEEHGYVSHHTVIEIVNDDMPFLVDSVGAELNRQELTVHLVIHPVLKVRRDASGKLVELLGSARDAAGEGEGGEPFSLESMMHIEISERSAPETLKSIAEGLARVLGDVRLAVMDWRAMRAKIGEALSGLDLAPPDFPRPEIAEAREFLEWIGNDNFTFLGYREYDYAGEVEIAALSICEGSGLGILRSEEVSVFDGLRNFESLPPEVQAFLRQPRLLLITKANRRSSVHRPVYMDTLAVRRFDEEGRIVGERLFVGLLTSVAYSKSPREIPLLRRKVRNVFARAGFPPQSHDGKALMHILENYPRDELLQIDEDTLHDICMGILHLQERQRVALFVRRDPFERFVSCLVYVPRDRYNTNLRLRFQEILEAAYDGKVEAFTTYMGDEALGRLHFIVSTKPGAIPEVPTAEIEARLLEAGRSWPDYLQDALVESEGEERGFAIFRRYAQAFPSAYRERFNARTAVSDIARIEEALATNRLAMTLYRPVEASPGEIHLKVYNATGQVPLSDILPMLEDMGFRVISEVPFTILGEGGRHAWLQDFVMQSSDHGEIDIGSIRAIFQDAFARIWEGAMEDDGFNRLVIRGGLAWREVMVVRAYCKYLRQTGITFSQAYMEETLANNPAIARLLVDLFLSRFDPASAANRAVRGKGIVVEIEHALDSVQVLDEDRILRRFLNLIQSSLRTNYFQKSADGAPKPYLSIKLDSHAVEELPLPRPLVEIFVYSPRVEAIHLRGGKVARGGIRWSDRREDFRTEILSLMKAQMVKNAVIVPVGSKGGFVVKRMPAEGGREAQMAEVVECYKILMRGLLDLTDNLKGATVVPPPDVVRLDGDDPYLVVAADKGTATFSDIANSVAIEYGFWLGDAFASGGSAGYDHKKMGITAKGAWEAVKRHFRELAIDIQTTDFTCVGVGDMSGDVFGNGMLLSRHTKLVGAFNHMHILIDPDPDPEASWAERKRLFDLPRSAWTDYDAKLISKGGGIYERKAKSIAISPEAKARFGIARDTLTPAELIQALLRAPVDLLFLGGIGTYVKAKNETAAEVGDRGNDALRIDGEAVRARVVGEGANLGFTQRGRIEYALAGGRINTDAVDNSAGVDTSDHEVNIEIFLGDVVDAGDMTLKQRDQLLQSMTDEVARLVLEDNYLQTQALSLAQAEGVETIDQQSRFMRALERIGKLDRAVEFLPSEEVIAEHAAASLGLTRPELAVLLAYAKMALYDELLPSDLPDEATLHSDLLGYFPEPLRARFDGAIARHRLRREIIATVLTNNLVNRMGITFVTDIREKTGQIPSEILRAYLIARDSFDLPRLWHEIEALDNQAPAEAQLALLRETMRLAERIVVWLLRNAAQPLSIADQIGRLRPEVANLAGEIEAVVAAPDRAEIERIMEDFMGRGVPGDLAAEIARLPYLAPAPDIVRIAGETKLPTGLVARVYFALGARFAFDWLRESADELNPESHWDKLAVAAILDDLASEQGELTVKVLKELDGAAPNASADTAVERWAGTRPAAVQRADFLIADLKNTQTPDLAMLAVANRQLRTLVGA